MEGGGGVHPTRTCRMRHGLAASSHLVPRAPRRPRDAAGATMPCARGHLDGLSKRHPDVVDSASGRETFMPIANQASMAR